MSLVAGDEEFALDVDDEGDGPVEEDTKPQGATDKQGKGKDKGKAPKRSLSLGKFGFKGKGSKGGFDDDQSKRASKKSKKEKGAKKKGKAHGEGDGNKGADVTDDKGPKKGPKGAPGGKAEGEQAKDKGDDKADKGKGRAKPVPKGKKSGDVEKVVDPEMPDGIPFALYSRRTSKLESALVESCPGCSHEFRVHRKQKEAQCPHCQEFLALVPEGGVKKDEAPAKESERERSRGVWLLGRNKKQPVHKDDEGEERSPQDQEGKPKRSKLGLLGLKRKKKGDQDQASKSQEEGPEEARPGQAPQERPAHAGPNEQEPLDEFEFEEDLLAEEPSNERPSQPEVVPTDEGPAHTLDDDVADDGTEGALEADEGLMEFDEIELEEGPVDPEPPVGPVEEGIVQDSADEDDSSQEPLLPSEETMDAEQGRDLEDLPDARDGDGGSDAPDPVTIREAGEAEAGIPEPLVAQPVEDEQELAGLPSFEVDGLEGADSEDDGDEGDDDKEAPRKGLKGLLRRRDR